MLRSTSDPTKHPCMLTSQPVQHPPATLSHSGESCMFQRLVFLLLFSSSVLAQQSASPLTIETIASGALVNRAPESVKWSPDGKTITFIHRDESGERGELIAMEVATGKKTVVVTEAKLASLSPPASRLSDGRLREWRIRYNVPAYHWSPDSKSLLFDANGQ